MLDSEFWRELAEKFRAIDDPMGILIAEWTAIQKPHWNLSCGRFATLAAQFEPLARRGGVKLNCAKDSLEGWLDSMRKEGTYQSEEMTHKKRVIACTIHDLFRQSADFCNRLESRALEEEHLQRRDPEKRGVIKKGKREQTDIAAKDCKARRRAQVEAFLKNCNKESSERIYKRHLWRSVGHSKPRQFEYWQECNEKKTTEEDKRNFGRILAMSPEDFIALLKRLELIA
jgi:hypothetical protein